MLRRTFCALAVLALSTIGLSNTASAKERLDRQDLPERDEINQTYSREDVSAIVINDIAGGVTIENSTTGNIELQVVRSAKTRAELEKKKIVVEKVDGRLAIHTEAHHGMSWDHSNVRQRVLLKVPTNVDLGISDVAGSVTIERIDGQVRINDIAGSVDIASTAGSPHINDIAGSVTITVTELDAGGIRINDIAGPVDLKVGRVAQANIRIEDISGSITVDVPSAVVEGKLDGESYHGKIGGGGPEIAIFDIAGSVELQSE